MWNVTAGGQEGCWEHCRVKKKKKVLQASMNHEPVGPARGLPEPGGVGGL